MFSGVGSAFPGASAGPDFHAVTDGNRVAIADPPGLISRNSARGAPDQVN